MKNEIYSSHSSSLLNADANMIAMLSYLASTVMGWIPILKYVSFFAPLMVYFLEKDSIFVKFHSMQAFLLNVISSVIAIIYSMVLGVSVIGIGIGIEHISTGIASMSIAVIVSVFVMILSVAILIFNILAMIGAYRYKEYHIPVIGSWAAGISHSND